MAFWQILILMVVFAVLVVLVDIAHFALIVSLVRDYLIDEFKKFYKELYKELTSND